MVVGVLLIGAAGLVVFATPLLGNRALIIRSGSMAPALNVGDVVIVRPGDYQVGEAIAYHVPGQDSMLVTHRIVAVQDGVYITKGDANAAVDSWVVRDGDIVGKAFFVVPYVGKLLALAKTKVGFVALVVLPAWLVIASEVRVIVNELRRRSAAAATPPTPKVLAVLAVLSLATVHSSWALFSDSGTSTSNVFTAMATFATPTPTVTPTPTPGSGDVVINEVMWMGSAGDANGEWIELRNMTSSAVSLDGWQVDSAASGTNAVILSGAISANGFWLLSRQATTSSAISNSITADQVSSLIRLDNSGEQLILRDASSFVVDQTPTGSWPAGIGSGGTRQSMERNSTPGDGTVGSNWHTCTAAGCNDTIYWDVEGNNYGTPKANNL